jgi:post-segregation antitoxin (ccd killing protein)
VEIEELLERVRALPLNQRNLIVALVNEFETQKQARERERQETRAALAAFAEEYGGTEFDLDKDFEAAGIEHWLAQEARYP